MPNIRTVADVDLAPPPADAAPTPAPPTLEEPAPPERIVGGVAALLAERLDVDALWLRIGFVLLALVGGVGLVLYGALWLAIPRRAGEESLLERGLHLGLDLAARLSGRPGGSGPPAVRES